MRIIVSLTSYPKRIKYVSMVVKTLLIQTRKPDMVILWLAETQFENKEKDLPEELVSLQNYGLTLRWCEDLKPHKKYFYAMQEYPEDIIITVDDDVYYSPRLVSTLIEGYEKHPNSVICTRANRMTRPDDEGRYDYSKFDIYYRGLINKELTDILPTGVGGVLYPPHCIPEAAFDAKLINDTCLYQDDIWLKAWSVVNDFTNVIVTDDIPIDLIRELQEDCLYLKNRGTENDTALFEVSNLLDKMYYNGIMVEKIFSSSKNTDSYWKQLRVKEDDLYNEATSILGRKPIYIYGAGKNAHIITEILQGIEIKPQMYLVTDPEDNPREFEGVKVLGIDELTVPNDDYWLIISPAESNHQKIITDLKIRGWKNFLLTRDVWTGELIKSKENGEIAVRNILLDFMKSDYRNTHSIGDD